MRVRKEQVLKWSQRWNWDSVLRRLLADKINEAVLTRARQINPLYPSDDNFEWLNSVVETTTNQRYEDIPALLAERLSCHYKFIIAFHGTRSNSAADFLEHGLKLSDTKALEQRAIKYFGNSDKLQNEIVQLRQSGYERHNHGKIYLCLTKQACLKECRGYLLDGSEYIATLANRLGQKAKLSAIGKPLIVECLIPTNLLESKSRLWQGRSYAMLEDYFARILHPTQKRKIASSCEIATQPIPAEIPELRSGTQKFRFWMPEFSLRR